MMDSLCNLSMIWRQVPADEICCQEIELNAFGAFSSIYGDIVDNLTGIYKRQLIPLNDNALYYKEDEGSNILVL